MRKFEKADKQEVTKCSKAEKVKTDTGTEDRGPADEVYSGQTGKNRREDTY